MSEKHYYSKHTPSFCKKGQFSSCADGFRNPAQSTDNSYRYPRIMIAGTSSGSGKTTITCGLLKALVDRGLATASFKCGPDYIDPMFHTRVIGTKSKNLDTFFTDDNTTRYLFAQTAKDVEISVIEGVMGYYDGLAGISTKASAYDLALTTRTPVILAVSCKGMSCSVLPLIKGFVDWKEEQPIAGVILNQLPGGLYPELKREIEAQLHLRVFGYVPPLKDFILESRHLGLVTPGEIQGLNGHLKQLAATLEETLDVPAILALAGQAPPLPHEAVTVRALEEPVTIAVARDEAFCFYYEDNLQLLGRMGARIAEFSPIRDKSLPENIDGLILGGGYPELAARELSKNRSMREDIRSALAQGLPCLAECGGFMYLHQTMEDMEGQPHEMVGAISGKAYKTERLSRFGYIELAASVDSLLGPAGTQLKGHEFHYFDSTACGDGFHATKPLRKSAWDCIHASSSLGAGFPHLYYYSNPDVPYEFLKTALSFKKAGKTAD